MFHRLLSSLKNMSRTSVLLMFYGIRLALGVLVIGIIAHLYNEYFLCSRYTNTIFCITVIQAAFSLFVQFIIGGLIFDCISSAKR